MKIQSVADNVKQYVRDRIIRGQLRPGQKINEEEIASKLGISRIPVREAFKILEGEGLVERKPRRGVFVAEITYRDIREIYTLKIALYGMATKLAAEKISDQWIMRLEKVVKNMEDCVKEEPPDIIRYQNLHESFHNIIIDIAENGRLKKIVSSLHNQVKRYSYKSLADRSHLKSSCRYHRQIFEAIQSKNNELAEKLTHEHILKGMEVLRKLFTPEMMK